MKPVTYKTLGTVKIWSHIKDIKDQLEQRNKGLF